MSKITKTNKITLQDIFNAAWQAFIIEKKPPAVQLKTNNYVCSYLTPDGRKCAIGLCIPDGHNLQTSIEYFDCIAHNSIFCDEIRNIGSVDLIKFQRQLHDNHINNKTGKWQVSPEELKQAYINIAHKFNLNIPNEIKENENQGIVS